MALTELGKLEEVDLRAAWLREDTDFTPWLAAHLDDLSTVIGLPLELEGTEVAVESFSADILARNSLDDSLVLIENQLADTDHTHLGQIMTYLAGLEAHTVIWIARDFREPHLSAVRWLNEHTDDDFAFFAIKVKVVRIGESPLAPVFDVLVRPNEWERQIQAVAKETQALSELGQLRKAFWEHYLRLFPQDVRDGHAGGYSNRWRKVNPPGIVISYFYRVSGVGLFVRGLTGVDNTEVFDILAPCSEEIERDLGVKIGRPEGYYLCLQEIPADTSDRNQWDRLARWLHEKTAQYEATLGAIVED